MKTRNLDYIDFEKVDTLLEGFNKSTGFVTAILDLEGNVLSKSGWRQICTDFHRINPITSKKCGISDTLLANKMTADKKYHFYKCLNGLIDVAVPIIINGEHIANLFSGQFFFEKPDISFFKNQAAEFGFDEKKYIEALDKVPVVPEEKVKTAMDFLLNMTQLISETIFQKFELQEDITERELAQEKMREKDLQFRKLSANVPDLIFQFTRKPDGSYCVPFASEGIMNIFGCTPEDVVDDFTPIGKVIFPEDSERVIADIDYSATHLTQFTCEYRVLIPGRPIQWILSRSSPEKLPDGSITWYGFNTNITERKHTEEEIKRQLDELQRWHQVTLGREGRILELKKEVNDLLHQRGEALRYGSTIPENPDVDSKF